MGLSVITLALAKQYADEVAAAGSKEALDKAVAQAVAESKSYTDTAISQLTTFDVKIVETLPTSDISTHTIYFVPRITPSGEEDYYYEYMYINSQWELIGSTELNLSAYWTSEQVKAYVRSQEYVLPSATKTTLGGVKVDGSSILINAEGIISVNTSDTTYVQSTENIAQGVVDKNFIDISSNEIQDLF